MPELQVETLDRMIVFWRGKLRQASTDEERLEARCYIDAYQHVRIAHELTALPQTEPGDDGRYT